MSEPTLAAIRFQWWRDALDELQAGTVRAHEVVRALDAVRGQGGMSIADVCRKHNCAQQSFHRWKAKFGGMDVSEAKRLKALEHENAELKKIVADQALDIRMLKDVNSRKW